MKNLAYYKNNNNDNHDLTGKAIKFVCLSGLVFNLLSAFLCYAVVQFNNNVVNHILMSQMVAASIYGFCLYSLKEKVLLSKILICLTANAQVLSICFIAGTDSMVTIFFVVCFCLPWLFFTHSEKVFSYSLSLFTALSSLIVTFLYDYGILKQLIQGAENKNPIFHLINTGLVYIILIYLMSLFSRLIAERELLIISEKQKSELLLHNMLPKEIVHRLKQGENRIADEIDRASIAFVDISGFTQFAKTQTANQLVNVLDSLFTMFDDVVAKHNAEKIKTVGDAYMFAAGVPKPQQNQSEIAANIALEMMMKTKIWREKRNLDLKIKIGIHCGPVVAGVIGNDKVVYDLWGHSVNLSARLQSTAEPDSIHISKDFAESLPSSYGSEPSKEICKIKGLGKLETYYLKTGSINWT